jgi:hypothetical protein
MAKSSSKGRGLASADAETRRRVAEMGGKAYHSKRGRSGSDNHSTES